MTSTTSSANKGAQALSVLQWQLRRSSGLLAIYTAVLMLGFPVLSVFSLAQVKNNWRNGYYGQGFSAEALQNILENDATSLLSDIHTILGVSAMLLFAILFTIWNFGFLHKKREIDLFHALPVSRSAMFWGRYFAGVLCLYVPFLVALGVEAIVFLAFGVFTPENSLLLLQVLGQQLLMTCAMFSFTVFVAVCSGSTLDTLASIALISGSYPVLILVGASVISCTIPGVSLTPDLMLTCALCPPLSAYFTAASLPGRFNFIPGFYLWWVFLTLVLLGAALAFYRRRKSESAESTVSYGPAKLVIRVLSSGAGGMLFAFLVYNLTPNMSAYLISFVLSSMVLYVVTELVYLKTLRRLYRHLLPYGAVLLLFGAFTLSVCFGFFGLDTYTPKVGEITYASLSNPFRGNMLHNYWWVAPAEEGKRYTEEERELLREQGEILQPGLSSPQRLEGMINLNKTLAEMSRQVQYPYFIGQNNFSARNYYEGYHFCIRYTLDGTSYSREYSFPKDFQSPLLEEAVASAEELFGSKEYYEGFFAFGATGILESVSKYSPETGVNSGLLLRDVEGKEAFLAQLEEAMGTDIQAMSSDLFTQSGKLEKATVDTRTDVIYTGDYASFHLTYSEFAPFTARGGFFKEEPAKGKSFLLTHPEEVTITAQEMPETYKLLEELFRQEARHTTGEDVG